MISYVIPTLLKDENLFKTIAFFSQIEDDSAELIIINNTKDQRIKHRDSRIQIVNLGFNSFVNPAWNLGVRLSKNDYVCIMNDDIFMNMSEFHTFVCKNSPEFIGFHHVNRPENMQNSYEENDSSTWELKVNEDINRRPYGFGQFMLIKKRNWEEIPTDAKIFHGDDIIYYGHTLKHGILSSRIHGMTIHGNQSVTAKDWYSSNIAKSDTIGYFKWISDNGMECNTGENTKSAWKREDYEYKYGIESRMKQ